MGLAERHCTLVFVDGARPQGIDAAPADLSVPSWVSREFREALERLIRLKPLLRMQGKNGHSLST
jgi:hypothetical protein